MLFFGSGSAHATKFRIAPVLTSTLTVCRRNRGDPSSLYRTYGALQVLQKHSHFGLAWSRPRADRCLSRPTSVFCTTTGVCKILPRSVEIWLYEGQKNLFWSKNKNGQGLAVQSINHAHERSSKAVCLQYFDVCPEVTTA